MSQQAINLVDKLNQQAKSTIYVNTCANTSIQQVSIQNPQGNTLNQEVRKLVNKSAYVENKKTNSNSPKFQPRSHQPSRQTNHQDFGKA
jgi:hypothetical protein